ncbi:MAG TPA: nucleotide exchange factor GrpE [Solirubrobacteraceae bacterium]|jgi:molecular chaperone GrpE|nr:nucleotide exchange factor GrpE [Solirubrobacteraceae bacterium]
MTEERSTQEVQNGPGVTPGPDSAAPTPAPGAESPACEADTLAGEPAVDGAPVEELDELTAVTRQRDEYLALAQRTQADFENYRKRMSREAKAAEARGVARLVKELLPALDNLERAVASAPAEDPLLEGIRLVQADLAAALTRLGVESFRPEGEPFDPAEHEAMAQRPVEGAAAGTVVDVYQAGYRLDGLVLRPARVVVAA